MIGIGGGGDVIGALAVGRRCEQLGTPFALGGVAWERFARDPRPGPRPLDQIRGGQPVGGQALLADPETATVDGVLFSEAYACAHLRENGAGEEVTVLIDVTGGAPGAAAGIAAAAGRLGCDLVILVDIGGDAIATGAEPGLQSPLCDSILLGAALREDRGFESVGVVLGAGCDGELEPVEVLERVAALARAGAWTGTWSVTAEVADEIETAARGSGTEASMQVVRCARGGLGPSPIRGGRRTVPLGPVGALAFCFDPVVGAAALPMAEAVKEADTLEGARAALEALGIHTELDYERERGRAGNETAQ